MDKGTMGTIIGTGIGTVSLIYLFLRNFKQDINDNFRKLEDRVQTNENRLFELALGKDFRKIIIAELIRSKNEESSSKI